MEGAGIIVERPLIVALDFESKEKVQTFLCPFQEPLYVKVGMELFFGEGPSIISYLKEEGHRIFLDLKLHDIPNTVKQAMRRLARLEIDLVNVHAAGGINMMEAALEGLDMGTSSGRKRPNIIAVTQLTSTSERMLKEEILIETPLLKTVLHYAKLAKESGLDGVVCSPNEVESIREACGESFMTITPGIRMQDDPHHDQVRVATPRLAREKGATGIVVGRSITKADDPVEAYMRVKKDWECEINA